MRAFRSGALAVFILKSTHAALMAAKDERIADLNRQVTVALEHADEVQTEYAAYVREMAQASTVQVHARTPQPVAKREPDQVDTAIDWKAQGNVLARRHLERWAKGERRKGRKPEDIAADIMNTRPTDDDEPVDMD